jgi:hypothetical protein
VDSLDEEGQSGPTPGLEWQSPAVGSSACCGISVQAPPGGGEVGTAQAGSPAEEASAPAAPSALEPLEVSPAVSGTAQAWSGFVVGLGLGLTPGGAVADQVLSTAGVLDRGTRPAQVGKAIGEMLGGFFLTASGVTGEIVGTGLTTTGIGAAVGVPAIVVSTGLVASGAGNMAAGLRGFSDALMSSGSGGGEQAAGGGGGGGGNIPKQVYNGVKNAPGYPQNFTTSRSGAQATTTRNNVSNKVLLEQLRQIEPWHMANSARRREMVGRTAWRRQYVIFTYG